MTTQEILEAARAARSALGLSSGEVRHAALLGMAEALCSPARQQAILDANAEDQDHAEKKGLSAAMIDRLWNKWVAAWFEGGKTDPKLLLLRFDLDRAQIWLNENNLLAGVKMLLGSDPKKDYADKTAEVRLN